MSHSEPALQASLVGTIYRPPRARQQWTIGDVLPPGSVSYYSLARWALVAALRAFGVGNGSRVLLPALICRDVLAAVHMVGATAVYYPVSRALEPTAFDPVEPVKAVVAVNYFGFPQDLQPFRELCTRTGAALIEDNAHGLFSRDDLGRWLGGRGDAGLFSFRKTIAVPDGATLVITRNAAMAAAGSAAVSRPAFRHRAKQVARRVAAQLGPVLALKSIAAVRELRSSVGGKQMPATAPDIETRIPLEPGPTRDICLPIVVADPDLEVQRRRALYALVGQLFEGGGADPVFSRLPEHTAPYGFPFFATEAQLPGMAARLAKHGLPVVSWPDLPAAVASSAEDHYRQLQIVPFLW